jgi:23S rRNA (adenine2503-C2)-methyltransferase
VKKNILDLTPLQLKESLKDIITKGYEFNQIMNWLYVKKVSSFEHFTNLSATTRKNLSQKFVLRTLKIHKKELSKTDGTVRYTFKTTDRLYFTTVLLPSKYKNSICISSQIGCPIKCSFCFSGRIPFIRNLSRAEILEQILQIENDSQLKISGILFMGIGEPLLNYNNLISALEIMVSKNGLYIGKKNIVVSTSGIVPAIKRLAVQNLNVRLAISLHAVDDKQRKSIMPNIAHTIDEILETSLFYSNKTNSRLTVEYILIKSLNDSLADAHKLARILKRKGIRQYQVCINLIPFNRIDKSKFEATDLGSIKRFQAILKLNGFSTMIRQSKGQDIKAACGQLGM